MNEPARELAEFVDHYFTLGIAIDSTGEVVEETYWRIMREWRSGTLDEHLKATDVDNLNEAYRVLTNPKLREMYDAERAEVLGPGAPPQGPPEEEPEAPLRVMDKQRVVLQREAVRDDPEPEPEFTLPWVPVLAGAGGALVAAIIAFIWFFV